jgi:hypothetical protein
VSVHLLLHLLLPREKRYETRLGFVADFCPICRAIRPFRLSETGRGKTVAGLESGRKDVDAHYIQCLECGVFLWTKDSNYSYVAEAYQPDLDLLVETTNLPLRFAYADRLKLEDQLKKGAARLSPEGRSALLMEPLTALASTVEKRFTDFGRLDTPSALACGGTVAVAGGLFFYSSRYLGGSAQDRGLVIAGIAFALGIAYSLLQWQLAPARFVKTQVAPMAARALKPLGPSRKELEDCLAECRQMGLRIGKVLKPEWLWTSLQRGDSPQPR